MKPEGSNFQLIITVQSTRDGPSVTNSLVGGRGLSDVTGPAVWMVRSSRRWKTVVLRVQTIYRRLCATPRIRGPLALPAAPVVDTPPLCLSASENVHKHTRILSATTARTDGVVDLAVIWLDIQWIGATKEGNVHEQTRILSVTTAGTDGVVDLAVMWLDTQWIDAKTEI